MNDRNKFLAIPILILCLATWLPGRSTTVKISGIVKNIDADYLPGVMVTVTHMESNTNTTDVTGENGRFNFLELIPGTYQASFDLEGYQSMTISGITLPPEHSINLNITLKKQEEKQESGSD